MVDQGIVITAVVVAVVVIGEELLIFVEEKEFGVEVLKQWAVLGPYDFVNLVEAPDNETIFKLSVELGSRGTIEITSMPAISIDELIKSLKP